MKILVAAFAIASAAASANAACTITKLAELPVTMSELRPAVHTTINGVDVRMLADSGAGLSMITPGTAAELRLPLRPAPLRFALRGIGGPTNASFTTVRNFKLDTIPLHEVDFAVGGSEIGQSLGGVLGRNILEFGDTEYDFANGAIRLLHPSGCRHRNLAYWAGTTPYSELDIVPDFGSGRGVKSVPGTIVYVWVNGTRLRAILDTGAATSALTLAAAKRAGVPTTGPGVDGVGVFRGIGPHVVRSFFAPVDSFKIGEEEIRPTRLRVIETSLYGEDVLLGADFFLSHRVFQVGSQHKVYLTYNGGPIFNLRAVPVDAPQLPSSAAERPDAVQPTTPPT